MVWPLAALAAVLLGTDRLGVEGQEVCWKCRADDSDDWKTWDCGFKTGERCLNNLGDWTSWDRCCGVSTATVNASGPMPVLQPAPKPHIPVIVSPLSSPVPAPPVPRPAAFPAPAPGPLPHRHRSVQTIQDCDCGWTHRPGGCDQFDGSHCWNMCCDKPHCDCSWTRSRGCGIPDGSLCWDFCCIKSTPQCDCAWIRNDGCQKDDGSPCWAQCCHVGSGSMTFFLKAVRAFGLAGSLASPSFWAGSVLAMVGFCGLFAVARRSAGGGVIRTILEKLTLQPAAEMLPVSQATRTEI